MKTLEKKAVITTTSLGSGTAGILPPKKMPGVVKLPRQKPARAPKK